MPLGCNACDRKIVVYSQEAETVRTIYRRYLKLRPLALLQQALRNEGIVGKYGVAAALGVSGVAPLWTVVPVRIDVMQRQSTRR